MSAGNLLRTAEKIVAYATRHGADVAEAFVERSNSGTVRIEKNHVGGIEADTTYGIGLRIVKDKRVGFSHLTSEEDVAAALKDALGNAKLAKRLPAFALPSSNKMPRISGIFDPKIAALSGPDIIELSMEMVRGAHDVRAGLNVTEAGASFGQMENAIANSEGLAVSSRETSIGASCFVVQSQEGISTGSANRESTRLNLNTKKLGAEAAQLALDGRKPKKLEGAGRRILVLKPDPAADLIGTLTVPSLYGRSAMRGESFYSKKVGKKVAHSKISLIDDPTVENGLGSSPFDDEGEVSRPFFAIKNGVLKTFLFDRSAGAEFKSKPTSSALRVHPFDGRSYKSPPGISARNVRLGAPSRATESLIAGVDDGLLVHDLMGVHTANTVSGDFSVTSTVLFRIIKGSVEGPVEPVSVAGNLHQALREGLVLGDDLKQTSGEAVIEMPSTRFESFTVTP